MADFDSSMLCARLPRRPRAFVPQRPAGQAGCLRRAGDGAFLSQAAGAGPDRPHPGRVRAAPPRPGGPRPRSAGRAAARILSEHTRGTGAGRLPTFFAPTQSMQLQLASRVEQLLPSDQLGSLPALSTTELSERLSALSDLDAMSRLTAGRCMTYRTACRRSRQALPQRRGQRRRSPALGRPVPAPGGRRGPGPGSWSRTRISGAVARGSPVNFVRGSAKLRASRAAVRAI